MSIVSALSCIYLQQVGMRGFTALYPICTRC